MMTIGLKLNGSAYYFDRDGGTIDALLFEATT